MTRSLPIRRSPRLQGYDYTQEGAYFVTICAHRREHRFGDIKNGDMHLSQSGLIAYRDWQAISQHYPNVELDAFVVMPNHVHGIILLAGVDFTLSASTLPASNTPNLSRIIAGYKAGVSRRINAQNQFSTTLWQRSFHDHIIRSEAELNRIRHYIANNPALWEQDTFYG